MKEQRKEMGMAEVVVVMVGGGYFKGIPCHKQEGRL